MIYADNAATTKLDEKVLSAMLPYLQDLYGNASSNYTLGHKSRSAVEQARSLVSSAIGAEAKEIFFTSGGSESDNWAIRGTALSRREKGNHIITTRIEHPAVLNTCVFLEKYGFEITYLPVDRFGRVNPRDIATAIRSTTILVSIMLVNNEVGTIQPIREIGMIAKSAGILLHTDAVQAIGHIPVDVGNLGVDLLSASAHKFHGPKGTGFLYIKANTGLSRLIFGGHQENGMRAGTENVAGIVGTGEAIELCSLDLHKHMEQMKATSNELITSLQAQIPNIIINGYQSDKSPGIVNISLPGVGGEALMLILDTKGICISTSSACASGNTDPSHVLLALGITPELANNTIRISFGRYNTLDDARIIAQEILKIYRKLN
jgi:cysteine desulfurase